MNCENKIFQIPFRMPIYTENHRRRYIHSCFDFDKFDEKQITILDQIISTLQLENPRTIKRILGVYRLLRNIQSERSKPEEKLNLLTLVIIQQYSLAIHKYLATQKMEKENWEEEFIQIKENEEKIKIFTELSQKNTFLQKWLKEQPYKKYLDLTDLVGSGSDSSSDVDESRSWNKSKVDDFIANIASDDGKRIGTLIHQMLYDLASESPSESTKSKYPSAKSYVVYGRGYKPAISLKVSNTKSFLLCYRNKL